MPKPTSTDGLRIDYIPLADLKHHPRNPKDHDVSAIARSVNRFGFTAPVLMDERTGYLAAGHGRIDTLAQLKAQGHEPLYVASILQRLADMGLEPRLVDDDGA